MPLAEKLLVAAVAAQVLLTLGILIWLEFERVPRVARGEIRTKDVAVSRDAWPMQARLLANNFDNQFQLPVLFYVGVLLSLLASAAGWAEAVLALAFVALRYWHAGIHVTTNNVVHRFALYTAGFVVLAAYWLLLAMRLLMAPGTA